MFHPCDYSMHSDVSKFENTLNCPATLEAISHVLEMVISFLTLFF